MNPRLRKILAAIFRPTPEQREAQKRKLDGGIARVHGAIDSFDKMMDELSQGLREATGGSGGDPVEGIMGKRDRMPDLHKAVFGKGTKERQAF